MDTKVVKKCVWVYMLHSKFKVWVVVHLYMVKKGWFFFVFLLTTYDLLTDVFTFSFFQMAVFDHLLCKEERLDFVFFCLSQKWAFCLSFVPTKCKQKVVFCTFWIFLKANKMCQKAYKMQSFIHLLCILKDDFSCKKHTVDFHILQLNPLSKDNE